MTNKLKEHFPMIRDREELMEIIHSDPKLETAFAGWQEEQQKEFLDFCTGVRGGKILYDSFFKEVMNPEYAPERLESFLRAVLKRKVKIVRIIPNDSTRIADEASLLITDIIVELEDGSLGNVEVQKIGYKFPGERSACYSADMLLRQYKRVRSRYGEAFSYHQIKNVYLIVIYEKSPKEFQAFSKDYFHHARQTFDTGLELNLLQEFVMIPLDIFKQNRDNKPIETLLDGWLTFLSADEPDRIIELINRYPEFKPMYETLYQMCRNVEKIMGFFSEELRILDRNTVKLMIEEQQNQLEEQQKEIDSLKEANEEKEAQIVKQAEQLDEKAAQIEALKKELEAYKEQITGKA